METCRAVCGCPSERAKSALLPVIGASVRTQMLRRDGWRVTRIVGLKSGAMTGDSMEDVDCADCRAGAFLKRVGPDVG